MLPEKIMLYETFLKPGQKVTMLGSNVALKYKSSGDGTVVFIPESMRGKPYCGYAWTLKIEKF